MTQVPLLRPRRGERARGVPHDRADPGVLQLRLSEAILCALVRSSAVGGGFADRNISGRKIAAKARQSTGNSLTEESRIMRGESWSEGIRMRGRQAKSAFHDSAQHDLAIVVSGRTPEPYSCPRFSCRLLRILASDPGHSCRPTRRGLCPCPSSPRQSAKPGTSARG